MVRACICHPGSWARFVHDLDVSGWRRWLGIRADGTKPRSRGLGVPFPPLKERFDRLDETLQVVLQMWRGDEQPFHGRYYDLDDR